MGGAQLLTLNAPAELRGSLQNDVTKKSSSYGKRFEILILENICYFKADGNYTQIF